jgi:putative redox protein
MSDLSVSLSIGKDKYKTTVNNGRHDLIADEPESLGGTDLGFGPKELLLSSLGSCIAMTIRMYADRKQIDLEEVQLTLRLEEVQSDHQTSTYINSHIRLIGNLDDKDRARILEISKKCPVHKILTNPIIIENNLVP